MKKTMTNRAAFTLLYDVLNDQKNRISRGAWKRGVYVYALEMVERVVDYFLFENEINCKFVANLDAHQLKKIILDGAMDWKEASYGGCWLIYNTDICYRLCNDSEVVKTNEGRKQPNTRENWLDVQARALYQAFELFYREYLNVLCAKGV